MNVSGYSSETSQEVVNKKQEVNIPKDSTIDIVSSYFWDRVFVKIMDTLLSVKVWGLVVVTIISTWLVVNKYITGDNWTTVITGVYGVIYGMREVFKISRIKEIISRNENEAEVSS